MGQRECTHPIVQTINETVKPLTIRCCGCDAVWTLDTMPTMRLARMIADSGGNDLFWVQINAGLRIIHTMEP